MNVQETLDLGHELIVDNFAGGGGASTGISAAFGRAIDVAINHDKVALSMHEANHGHTKHYCESVWDVDPIEVTKNQPLALVWLSPDCKHFSKAKGGTPVDKKIRGLAWVALRWAEKCKPRVAMLENVEEFTTWGPLIRNKKGDLVPDPKRKGATFKSFVDQFEAKGYKVEFKQLRACDYGAPTIRKRLFMVARRDGLPICWPEPTHGSPESAEVLSGKLLPWRTAGECIDWSIPCRSIFDRNKALATSTLKRIAKGLMQYVVNSKNPYIVDVTNLVDQGSLGDNGSRHDKVIAFIAKHFTGVVGSGLNSPLGTVTCVDHNSLVVASITKFNTGAVGSGLDEPLHTITAGGEQARPGTACTMGLLTSHLVKSDVIEAGNGEIAAKAQRVRAFLLTYYGSEKGIDSINSPLRTVTSRERFGLVTIKGEYYQIVDIGMRMLTPRELFRAQGFPDDYIIGDDGRGGLKLPKYAQVRMCGNSVSPLVAEALVRANFKHEEKLSKSIAA